MIPGYDNHRPSGLNLFAACPSMFVCEYVLGIKQPVGAPAHRGTAVEAGLAHALTHPEARVEACIDIAKRKFARLMASSSDQRQPAYMKTIPGMVAHAMLELRQYGAPSETQRRHEWRPRELKLPIRGTSDFVWDQHGILLDLKTTDKCPGEIKIAHARQVAMYAGSNNVDARVCYVTPKRHEIYRIENLDQHRHALLRIAQAVERFLSLSDDPEFYRQLIVPDLESFYWKNPTARAIAYRNWGI